MLMAVYCYCYFYSMCCGGVITSPNTFSLLSYVTVLAHSVSSASCMLCYMPVCQNAGTSPGRSHKEFNLAGYKSSQEQFIATRSSSIGSALKMCEARTLIQCPESMFMVLCEP